jgi:SAM-dependent methyltransferase
MEAEIVRAIKRIYRTLLPASVRSSPITTKLKAQVLGVPHDWIYDSGYYTIPISEFGVRRAGRIASTILNDFRGKCVIDVGCGTGALLEALRDRGCEVFGLEYSEVALRYCRSRRLRVAKFDLEKDIFRDNRTFDLAISMEVGEHLPEMVANRYVDLLTRLSQVIVFTAAPPGQGGIDHVNEQLPLYWISKFQQRGFKHAQELSQCWRESWKAGGDVESYYHQNLMIFRQVQQT